MCDLLRRIARCNDAINVVDVHRIMCCGRWLIFRQEDSSLRAEAEYLFDRIRSGAVRGLGCYQYIRTADDN